LVPFLQFDTHIRTVISTTNAIHARGRFGNEQVAMKCVYLP